MANTTRPLTNTEVKQARPRAKEFNLADGQGLYLRVKPNGTKLWLFNYSRPFTKKRANLSLGVYPSLSLAEAREEARALRGVLAKDIDPKEYRIEQNRRNNKAHINTFEHVSSKWLSLKESRISKSYYKKISSRLELHVFPKIGKIPLHKLNAVEVIDALEPLGREGKLETINNICGWINEIMVYAVNTGLIFANPLSGIAKAFNAPKTTNLPTLEPNQLPELMSALVRARIRPVTRLLIAWQLHTMVRPSEASGARWDEIDLEGGIWEIPAERTKGRRPHVIPLSSQALQILEELGPLTGHREHVFAASRNPRQPVNSQTANMALKRMGFKGQLVSHGLRALASTTLNEQGFDPDVIESALAHVDKNSIRSAYNRAQYLEQRKRMMQWWSDHIEEATIGKRAKLKGIKHLKIA